MLFFTAVLLRANLVSGALSTPFHSLSTLTQANMLGLRFHSTLVKVVMAPAINRDLLKSWSSFPDSWGKLKQAGLSRSRCLESWGP